MKIVNLIAIVFFATFLQGTAQTVVTGGVVSGHWTKASSPYIIRGSLQIPNDSTLILDPGVVLDFRGKYKINVLGRLVAVGSVTDSIRFITTVPQFVIPPPIPPADDSTHWTGIELNNVAITNDSTLFRFCVFEYARGDMFNSGLYAINIDNYSKVSIRNSRFSNCGSQYGGGGIYAYNGASPPVTNNVFSNNFSIGIYADYGCNSLILSNIICNNKRGGIILNNSRAMVINNIIANNTMFGGTHSAGLSVLNYGQPVIVNNTIVNNHSVNKGGGLYFDNTSAGQNPSIINCIVWGNTAASGGNQVYMDDEENDPNFYHCLIQGGVAAFDVNGKIYTGTYLNNMDSNPRFVKPTLGSGVDYQAIHDTISWALQANSPCIDKGLPDYNYPEEDYTGNPRVNVCRIDIGAYEYQLGIPMRISFQVNNTIVCNGDSTGALTATVTGGTPPFRYSWSNGDTLASVQHLPADTFLLTVQSPANGCSISKSIILSQPEKLTVNAGRDTMLTCRSVYHHDSVKTNFHSPQQLKYLWTPATGLSSDTVPDPIVTTNQLILYLIKITTPQGCVAFDTQMVTVKPMLPLPICVVGVDANNKNQLAWNKPLSTAIDSFYIMKETNVTGQYQRIGANSYGVLSIFIDQNADPATQSNKYKMSVLDKCGLESSSSEPHKTMHLTINKGTGTSWNLIWESYVGFTASTYNIYRGTTSSNLSLIGSSSASNTQYTDVNPGAGNFYYQVEIISPNVCSPSKNYNGSRSNIASTLANGVGSVAYNENDVLVYPNPATDIINIVSVNGSNHQGAIFRLVNLMGQTIFTYSVNDAGTQVSTGDLSKGIYHYVIKTKEELIKTGTLVIQ